MAKAFANKFKRIMKSNQTVPNMITGTILNVKPLTVSCYDGQWILTADDLQISNHVSLHTGDSVVLSGEDPFCVISVLSDSDPDEYEPPQAVIIDDALSDTSGNPVQNKVVTEAISDASAALEDIKSSVASLQASLRSAVSEHDSINAQIEQVKAAMQGISTSLDGYVSKSGDTISGDLTVAGKINGCTICDRNTVGGTFVYGGSVVVDSTSTGLDWAAAHPSYVGSIKDNGSWYNYISVRHQNGNGDGNAYGMRFWSPLHSQGDLRWQQQVNSWGSAKVIIDNSNISTYLPTGAPGTKGGAQFASGGINVGSVSAGSYKDYPHIFSGTFGGTPNVVVCTYESSAGTSASGNVARKAIVTKRSSTGFTVRLYNNSSSTWSPYVEYIAIYKG